MPLRDQDLRKQLRALLSDGTSMLINADADLVLPGLCTSAAGLFRAAVIDPPYNRRTKFHHYGDSTDRDTWSRQRS